MALPLPIPPIFNMALPIPPILKPLDLLQAYYQVSDNRLNANIEAMLTFATLDQEKTTPMDFVYNIDPIIQDGDFKAMAYIIGSLLYAVLKEVCDGITIKLEPNVIHFHPAIILKKIHNIDPKPFGKFPLN